MIFVSILTSGKYIKTKTYLNILSFEVLLKNNDKITIDKFNMII